MANQNKDSYIVALSDIISDLENIYGLTEQVNGTYLWKFDIIDVIQAVKSKRNSIDSAIEYDMNIAAGKATVLLSYVSARMTFFNKKRLDYSSYPAMKTVGNILIQFTNSSTVTKDTIKLVNKIIVVLSQIDNKYVNHRYGLGYRYLRIFIVLILYGNYTNASVVADFILNQFVTKR